LVVALVGCTSSGPPVAGSQDGASLAASVCVNGVVSDFTLPHDGSPPSGAEQTPYEALNGFTRVRNRDTKYRYELTSGGWAVGKDHKGNVVRVVTFTESGPNFYVADQLITCK
jgi:hypothetical protein